MGLEIFPLIILIPFLDFFYNHPNLMKRTRKINMNPHKGT